MDKSTFVEFELKDQTVELTLNFYRLNQLKSKHKNEYKRYFELTKGAGVQNDLEAVELIYVAYLCANMEKMPDVMSYEEFLQNMKNGRARIWAAVRDLNTDEKN